jgi:hypothetical protein
MEHNKNNNEFEHFLRDSIADFIMIPQRKVWYSIYNHLHPEKRWPSIAVCFCILVSIMFIGITNNKNINSEIQQAKNEMQNKQNIFAAQIKIDNTTPTFTNNVSNKILKEKIELSVTSNNSNHNNTDIYVVENNSEKEFISYTKSESKAKVNVGIENAIVTEDILAESKEKSAIASIVSEKENIVSANVNNTINVLESFSTKNNTENKIAIAEKKNDQITENNYSVYNTLVKIPKRKKKKEITYYVTPSIGYRFLEQDEALITNGSPSTFAAITNNYGLDAATLKDNKAFNFEIGAAANKSIGKNFKIKVGVQANYTNYISKATSLSHPTQSVVALRSSNSSYQSMDFASAPGNINLNKSTLQISVPLGIEHTILGNDKIKWNVAATLQPGFVIAGKGYVLSADKKYYVSEKDLLNRFNISAGLESFLSIKTANGIYLNVGPQFRYQITSTYKKNYYFSENLYNIGLKIGVTTTL